MARGPASDGVLGFTLLEIMVAVAILGLSLSVILSAQAGLFASGTYAQHMSVALPLARCKMSELEENFLKLGYPEIDTTDEGPCCADEVRQDFRCSWKIERVELPNPMMTDPSQQDGGVAPAGSAGLSLGSSPSPLGMLAGATDTLPGGNALPTDLSSIPGVSGALPGGGTNALSGVLSAGAMGGTGAIAPMVMGIVYPSLKPMLEASIRKVTVTVTWREGMVSRDFELLQWVANPTKGGFLAEAIGTDSAGIPDLSGMGAGQGMGQGIGAGQGAGLTGGMRVGGGR